VQRRIPWYNSWNETHRSAFRFGLSALSAQDWAKQKLEKSTRHREWVTVKHDGRSVEAYVVYPEVANKAPVVLVIHEIFGLSDWAAGPDHGRPECGGRFRMGPYGGSAGKLVEVAPLWDRRYRLSIDWRPISR
jgi:hypothetical protein